MKREVDFSEISHIVKVLNENGGKFFPPTVIQRALAANHRNGYTHKSIFQETCGIGKSNS